jgi:O-antigen/teichoic acid export membrane protein
VNFLQEYKIFAQRIGVMGVVNILATLSSIILLPILTKNLNIVDYGIWVELNVTITLIPGIISFGLPYAMVRFLAAEKRKEYIQEGFYSIAAAIILASLVVSLLIFIFSNPISHYLFAGNVEVVQILAVIIFMACLNAFLLNYFRTFQQVGKFSLFLLLQSYLTLVLVSYFALSGFGILYVVLGFLVAQLVIFILMISLIVRDIGFKIPTFTPLREYLSFGIPSITINLSSWTVSSSDVYIISLILGTAFVGYYSPAYNLGNLLFIFLTPFSLHLTPVLSENYDQGRVDSVKKLLEYSQKYFLLLTIPAFFGLSFLAQPILLILTTPEIALNGYLVTPFVALGALLAGISSNYRQIIVLTKKTKIIGYIWILAALINLFLNILLIPYLGILGAALTTLIGYGVICIFTIFYALKIIKFNPDLVFIVKSVAASLIMSLFIMELAPRGLVMVAVTMVISALIYFIVLISLKGISREEFRFIRGLFKIN